MQALAGQAGSLPGRQRRGGAAGGPVRRAASCHAGACRAHAGLAVRRLNHLTHPPTTAANACRPCAVSPPRRRLQRRVCALALGPAVRYRAPGPVPPVEHQGTPAGRLPARCRVALAPPAALSQLARTCHATPPTLAPPSCAHPPPQPLTMPSPATSTLTPPLQATAVVAMLERRAGEELFRKHVGDVVAGAIAAVQAEQAAVAGTASGAAGPSQSPAARPSPAAGSEGAAAAASPGPAAAGVPGSSPQQQKQQQRGGAAQRASRLLDTMTFLNDLGRHVWGGGGGARIQNAPLAALLGIQLRARVHSRAAVPSADAAAGGGTAALASVPATPDPRTCLPTASHSTDGPPPPCRAGSFRKEMGPFAVRWVYGRGVPHITAAYIHHRWAVAAAAAACVCASGSVCGGQGSRGRAAQLVRCGAGGLPSCGGGLQQRRRPARCCPCIQPLRPSAPTLPLTSHASPPPLFPSLAAACLRWNLP